MRPSSNYHKVLTPQLVLGCFAFGFCASSDDAGQSRECLTQIPQAIDLRTLATSKITLVGRTSATSLVSMNSPSQIVWSAISELPFPQIISEGWKLNIRARWLSKGTDITPESNIKCMTFSLDCKMVHEVSPNLSGNTVADHQVTIPESSYYLTRTSTRNHAFQCNSHTPLPQRCDKLRIKLNDALR